jgi:dethiobiotin synthetase
VNTLPSERPRGGESDSGRRARPGRFLVVTGTDTGVGKTVFASLLVRAFRQAGVQAIGLKPLCSGGREDAMALRDAAAGRLALDDVNPWSFAAALTPSVAAQRVGKSVGLTQVVAHIRQVSRPFELAVVEGAGGLLSPLGVDCDTRSLIRALQATPIVVCPNRLGAINQSLLVWEALPRARRPQTRLVLVEPPASDGSQRSNVTLLRERLGRERVMVLPRLSEADMHDPNQAVRRLGRRLRTGLGMRARG